MILISIFIFIYIYRIRFNHIDNFNNNNINLQEFEEKNINYYQQYINDCYNSKIYTRKDIKNKIPFVSICLAAHNVEKYLESCILSIINQSFQDYEIIVVNDFSNDNTSIVLEKFKSNNKIKIINQQKNLGSYASHVNGANNSNGKYLILMDADDLLVNPDLLAILYNYYLKYNLDIIEFKVI